MTRKHYGSPRVKSLPIRQEGYLRSVVTAITWRSCVISVSLGFVVSILRWLQNSSHAPANFVYSNLLITNMGALLVMLAALAADQAVRRGARSWLTYSVALACASVGTAWGQFYLRGLLHLYTAVSKPGVPIPMQRTQMLFVAFDVVLFGGLAMLAFMHRSSAQRLLQEVRLTELKRVQAERILTESSLTAARALVDPDALFEQLGRIKALYLCGAGDAETKLNELIERLHNAIRPSALPAERRYQAP